MGFNLFADKFGELTVRLPNANNTVGLVDKSISLTVLQDFSNFSCLSVCQEDLIFLQIFAEL